jgi:hypothetical protein
VLQARKKNRKGSRMRIRRFRLQHEVEETATATITDESISASLSTIPKFTTSFFRHENTSLSARERVFVLASRLI